MVAGVRVQQRTHLTHRGGQIAVAEAARNLAGYPKASSTEFGPTSEPVVGLMTEWLKGNDLVYAGKVDLGFDKTSAAELQARLRERAASKNAPGSWIVGRG